MAKLTLRITGSSPETLNINQLSDYLKKLVAFCNPKDDPTLEGITKGSACVAINIGDQYAEATKNKILKASQGIGAKSSQNAFAGITKIMDKYNHGGEVLMDGHNVVEFPINRKKPNKRVCSVLTTIKGKVYRVGGTDATVPVRIESVDGTKINAEADIETSKELGAILYQHVRVSGLGDWEGDDKGNWNLVKLIINEFEVINDMSLADAFKVLRSIGGIDDGVNTHSEILRLRGSE